MGLLKDYFIETFTEINVSNFRHGFRPKTDQKRLSIPQKIYENDALWDNVEVANARGKDKENYVFILANRLFCLAL